MTYNEWRDELKSNLLSVSEPERRRVLDYYAEAYADRREAGFSEREIIEEFGAPYDAAQKILRESFDDEPTKTRADTPLRADERPHEERRDEGRERRRDDRRYDEGRERSEPIKTTRENYGWVFVILCIIFAAPLFGLIMGMVGITIGLCVAPFALIISGVASIVASIVQVFGGEFAYGCYLLGVGFIELGVGIALLPLFGKIVKFMWKLFRKIMTAIRNLFTGKESAI